MQYVVIEMILILRRLSTLLKCLWNVNLNVHKKKKKSLESD